MQNLEGGGSIAVDREVYFALGGFDEEFFGWGGEDNEFWERALTRPVYNYGYLPLFHLWHRSQPEKRADGESPGRRRYRQLTTEPPDRRIARLQTCGGPGAGASVIASDGGRHEADRRVDTVARISCPSELTAGDRETLGGIS